MDEDRKEAYRYLLFGASAIVAVPLVLAAAIAAIGALWVFTNSNVRYHSCVPIDDVYFLGREAVFDLSAPYFRPGVVMKTADGVPVSGMVDLTGRGPFKALKDDAGYCSVQWDNVIGFHGGCQHPEGEGGDFRASPFHRVTSGIFRSLDNPPLRCRTRFLTW